MKKIHGRGHVKSIVVGQDNDDGMEYRGKLPAFKGINCEVKIDPKVVKKKNNNGANTADKTQEADTKRQNALAEKWKTLQNQKCAITKALKGESLNKKITFDDYGDQQESTETTSQSKKKVSLFDEDNSDHENQEDLIPDFKLKLRFEGEKGKKLFHMQTSKGTGDDRFVMDKRFFEEQEKTEKMSDDEIEKQMNILEDVVGRSISKPKKNTEDQMFNMVRYDPTQEEHKIYVKDKHELPKQKRQKKQKLGQTKIVAEPVVDTDKYYKVGDKLKDVFSNPNEFSLTSLFPTSNKIHKDIDHDQYRTEKITKPHKKFERNPFRDDSSDSDNEDTNYEDITENNDKIKEVPSGKILGSRGVWREVFFFKEDDSRFKDADEFYDPKYNRINYTGSQDPRFIKKRDLIKEFLKNKEKRHKRSVSKKLFSRKLGGTHNNQKNKKTMYKSRGIKNVNVNKTK